MEFGSLDGGEDGEYNIQWYYFVEISKILVMQDTGTISVD